MVGQDPPYEVLRGIWMDTLDHIDKALGDIAAASTREDLEALRVALLGKTGSITAQLKALGKLPPDERKARGAAINKTKQRLQTAITERREALQRAALDQRLASERVDVTLPGRRGERGSLHPVTRALERMAGIFERLGYQRAEGPEIEDDWHNFEALNFPPHHTARAMHETFYFWDGSMMRTHTSPVHIRAMNGIQPPHSYIVPVTDL